MEDEDAGAADEDLNDEDDDAATLEGDDADAAAAMSPHETRSVPAKALV